LVRVLRTQVDVVLPEGAAVLNADDPRILAMAELSDGEVVLYAADASSEPLANHRETGGRAVALRDGMILLADGASTVVCGNGRGAALVRRLGAPIVLPAVAAGWALGLAPALIAAGLETFEAQPMTLR
jgi:cyanophycin synthetase